MTWHYNTHSHSFDDYNHYINHIKRIQATVQSERLLDWRREEWQLRHVSEPVFGLLHPGCCNTMAFTLASLQQSKACACQGLVTIRRWFSRYLDKRDFCASTSYACWRLSCFHCVPLSQSPTLALRLCWGLAEGM